MSNESVDTSTTIDPVVNVDPAATDNSEVVVNTKIKMKKQFDPETKGYIMVPKNVPLKVLVPRKVTSPKKMRKLQLAMLAQYGLRAKPVSESEVKARINRISRRRRRKKIAEKMKWKNYHLAQEVR